MRLKNLHNRQEYTKMNEFWGSEGGVGRKDGFANNAKMKDTMVGKLFNGVFQGIGWLYKKAKNNFFINRLNAQLINELFRGIILFCFANNVDLKTGKKIDNTDLKTKSETKIEKNQQKSNIIQKPEVKLNNIDDKLENICKTKYNFNPDSNSTGLNDPKPTEYSNIINTINNKNYDPLLIAHGDKFRIINSNEQIEDITIDNVDINNKSVSYLTSDNKSGTILISNLLPSDFVGYDNIIKSCDSFLRKNISNYDQMSEDDKNRLEAVYMNYKLINKIKSKTPSKVNENSEFINENVAKIKLDNPQAGKIFGPSIALTVGDILNSRDREKFKDNDTLKMPLKNINLAEIEKYIELEEKNGKHSKNIVASYVNKYNLNIIKLTAEQLMLKESNENRKLKLEWEKTMAKTYSSFSGLINISAIDTNDHTHKMDLLVNKKVKENNELLDDAKISSKLPLIEDIYANYSSMANNSNSWVYLNLKYKDVIYKVVASPYQSEFDDYGLLRITCAFKDINEKNHEIIPDEKFFNEFLSVYVDDPEFKNGTPKQKNVYIMFKFNTIFPASTKSKNIDILVFNEFIMNDGKIFMFMKNKNGENLTVDVSKLDINIKDYKHSIEILNNKHIKLSDLTDISKKNLNITKDTDLRSGNKPKCLMTKNKTVETGLLIAGKKIQ